MLNKELQGILLIALSGMALHSIGSWVLNKNRAARPASAEMSVALPIPAQLLLASGDRYLAANVNVFRAFMVDATTVPDVATITTQAKLQTTASIFNPAHADNYYLAAATLSWQGAVPTAQEVLLAAINGRPKDVYPGFYYAFNKKYFEHDIIGAAKALNQTALRAIGGDQQALTAMAARWSEHADDSNEALNIVRAMTKQTRDPALKKYLAQRAQRLEGLVTLQLAAKKYTLAKGKNLNNLDELIQAGFITTIPNDPTEQGYGLNEQGKPILLSAKKK